MMDTDLTIDTKKKVPSLRFVGFDEEWEEKKLGEVAEINPSNKNLPDKFIYIDLESVINGELLKEKEVLKNESPSRAQRVLKPNDILFQMVRPYQMNNLFFDKNGIYVASTGYAQIRTNQSTRFIYQYLHFQKFIDKVIERCTGTSYPAINSTDLSKIPINLPTLPEQQKIASFLTAVDKKLQALKQQKNLLEEYKKGMMQKIFSQEIRFKDDDGKAFREWEMKKLGEVLIKNSKKNKNKKYDLVQSVSNKFGFVNQNEYFEDRVIASKDLSNYYVIQKGNFAYNPSRIDVGSLAYKYDDAISVISPLYISFNANDNYLEDSFLLNWFTTQKFTRQMNSSFEGSVRNTLSYESLTKIKIRLPTLPEQTKIAHFLSAIDEKISHCQVQITKMEQYKKGLLQQLFV